MFIYRIYPRFYNNWDVENVIGVVGFVMWCVWYVWYVFLRWKNFTGWKFLLLSPGIVVWLAIGVCAKSLCVIKWIIYKHPTTKLSMKTSKLYFMQMLLVSFSLCYCLSIFTVANKEDQTFKRQSYCIIVRRNKITDLLQVSFVPLRRDGCQKKKLSDIISYKSG